MNGRDPWKVFSTSCESRSLNNLRYARIRIRWNYHQAEIGNRQSIKKAAAMNRIDETNDERKAVERWENEGCRWLAPEHFPNDR
jgi:hypothetical protein